MKPEDLEEVRAADNVEDRRPDWKVLILRLMAGGYLIYLAYHLIGEKGPSFGAVYLLGPLFFLVMGLILGGVAVKKLATGEFRR